MLILEGKPIYNGTVIGKILFYSKNPRPINREKVADADIELARFETAKEIAKGQLTALSGRAATETGKTNSMIFEAHSMLLEDDNFVEAVRDLIRVEKMNAEYAVATTGDNIAAMFSQMEDEYFQARSADMKDIAERVIRILQNDENSLINLTESVILVTEELTPSEMVQLDKSKLLSFVTRLGSSNSHTAILARAMSLPSLIGVKIQKEWNGHEAIVDANAGQLIIDPDEATLEYYSAIAGSEEERRNLLKTLKGQPNVTKDGKSIQLCANIENVADIANVLANDADGIGLFRSEFLYLEKNDYPTEDEQFGVYKTVAQGMMGRKVVIRTLDIGADKKADYFKLAHEDNPAMGYRAVRICLDRVDLFREQLRAIYRASAFGNVSVMIPMIISLEEVLEVKHICGEIRDELAARGVPFKEIEIGIMIETPAAVMISDILAKEVDFFSIGTNDLTQYTLAIDRQNPKLDKIYNPYHEAVLRMIKMVIDNGHAGGCRVGICGELGADTVLTEKFIQMGIDELSVSPAFILPVRKAIRDSIGILT